jgi:hypothetical protein
MPQPRIGKSSLESRGNGNSSHVVWLKKGGWKDWSLKRFIVDGDWTFVTMNSIDFRGPSSRRGSEGQYSVALHAGLICLNGPEGMDLNLQLELFELALDEIGDGDLVNQVLEITIEQQTEIRVLRYALPPD